MQAEGRDDLDMPANQFFSRSVEVRRPVLHEGTLTYFNYIEDFVQNGRHGSYWAARRNTVQQPSVPPITTSDTPGPVLPAAGMGTHQVYRQ